MISTRTKLTSTLSIALLAVILLAGITAVPRTSSAANPRTPGIIQPSLGSSSQIFPIALHGRGATFPAPMINNWTAIYHLANPNVTIGYKAVGSGAGQNALFNKTDDFDASDAPLQPAQRPLAPNVLHIPETIGSVTISYNIPNVSVNLNLTGAIVAQIYLGQILNWSDPAIQSINPGVSLPNHQITTVHRADSSGTTFVFTSWLSKDSPTWNSTIGFGTTVAWPGSPTGTPPPIALTGSGNGGVAAVVAGTQYSIGYVELNYALTNHFTFAAVQNPVGNYIVPSLATTLYAVQNASTTLPPGSGDWSTVSMLNKAGTQTYPIASFTYFLVYQELNVVPSMAINETEQANALINFLYWVVNKGQQYTSALNYVPLPTIVRQIDNNSIASITLTINSTPLQRTIHLTESATGGWNGTSPGPALTVFSGDTINFQLSSTDTSPHQWFVDYYGNGIPSVNEPQSVVFSSATATPSAVTPTIGVNAFMPGTFTYKDANNPTNTGTITILQQQIAAPFPVAKSLSASNTPKLDSSKVTTIGSAIIDARTNIAAGSISVVAVDSTSGSITFQKTYAVSGLKLHTVPFAPGFQIRFILNAAVLPYALSPIILLSLQGTTPTISNTLTRQVDIAGNGVVTIVDIGIVSFRYGTSIGQTNYLPTADLNGDGSITIVDISIVDLCYGSQVYR